jgi:hypothetical protein
MKRFLILCVLALSLASCSVSNDDNLDFRSVYLPIETVDIPTEFELGESYEISATYYRPTTCYAFNDFYYYIDMNQITVIVNNTVYENAVCEPLNEELVEASFNFRASNSGTYIFKFWQGADENGNDVYYIVEVPVIE